MVKLKFGAYKKKAKKDLRIKRSAVKCTIALAGNPNVGKSTVFNKITGMNQHTGNWSGKTVTCAQGGYTYNEDKYLLIDLPGTYSLIARSAEEMTARDFICSSHPDVIVIVCDATCLERNMNLVLQILEITRRVVVCINLMDEALKKGIMINTKTISDQLGVPVVGMSARSGKGIEELKKQIAFVAEGAESAPYIIEYSEKVEQAVARMLPEITNIEFGRFNHINRRWLALRLLEGDSAITHFMSDDNMSKCTDCLSIYAINREKLCDEYVNAIINRVDFICAQAVSGYERYSNRSRKIDRILTGRLTGIPIMLTLLGIIFWITLTGANMPSAWISQILFRVGEYLSAGMHAIGSPEWLHSAVIDGIYRVLIWVVSVMLPPMAIFFPLFTILEDAGFLPRIAFNLDRYFKKACTCGKQALTMCMGFGCNAAGVVGCRIIDSPRERMIAMLTNNFVPCNGRFPFMIAIIGMFFVHTYGGISASLISAAILVSVILFGIVMTLLLSKLLSHTVLKGLPSSFTLELPPYRTPQFGKVISRSIFDRTLFVLGRAAVVAAPAGLVIWCMSNISVYDMSLLAYFTNFLDPLGRILGMDGVILAAFILGFPANEIVMPMIIMGYTFAGTPVDLPGTEALRQLLLENSWTWLTALCTIIFSLIHWPCSTTCLTIKKESGSLKWTAVSILLPTITGMLLCATVAFVARMFI